MTINIKDVNDDVVEISSENFADMMNQLFQESEADSPDIEMFIEWVQNGCLDYSDEGDDYLDLES